MLKLLDDSHVKVEIEMRALIPAMTAMTLCGTTLGANGILDINGFESWDFLGDSNNLQFYVVPSFGSHVTVTNISWDLTLTTFDVSWAEEATFSLFNSMGVHMSISPGSGDAFSVTNMHYAGSAGTSLVLSIDDPMILEFHETGFDDLPDTPDAIYGPESWIRMENLFPSDLEILFIPVPAPGAWSTLALGGLVALRRSRRPSA
jgi:hypothetical protein